MLKSKIAALFLPTQCLPTLCLPTLCLLTLSLAGCTETTTNNNPTERTGAVGVTSQDIDDLAKPAAPAKNPN